MLVYHFLNEKYGLESLKKKRLRISRLNELNDPFEFISADTSNYVTRKVLHMRKRKTNKRVGIMCFSKNWNSPVQWAHYGDRHKGICLGFEIPDHKLLEVEYVDERIATRVFWDSFPGPYQEFVRYALSKKFSHWKYEEECRAIIQLGETDEGLHYSSFSEDLLLKVVLLGCRSTISKKDIQRSLGETYSHVKVFLTAVSPSLFKIIKAGDI